MPRCGFAFSVMWWLNVNSFYICMHFRMLLLSWVSVCALKRALVLAFLHICNSLPCSLITHLFCYSYPTLISIFFTKLMSISHSLDSLHLPHRPSYLPKLMEKHSYKIEATIHMLKKMSNVCLSWSELYPSGWLFVPYSFTWIFHNLHFITAN